MKYKGHLIVLCWFNLRFARHFGQRFVQLVPEELETSCRLFGMLLFVNFPLSICSFSNSFYMMQLLYSWLKEFRGRVVFNLQCRGVKRVLLQIEADTGAAVTEEEQQQLLSSGANIHL